MNKKQLKLQSGYYKEAYESILKSYPTWKRNAIIEDMNSSKDSSLVSSFIKQVISQAEATELNLNAQKALGNKKVEKSISTQTVKS